MSEDYEKFNFNIIALFNVCMPQEERHPYLGSKPGKW